jgi:HSP20 family protein
MALVRLDPFRDLNSFQGPLDRFFGLSGREQRNTSTSSWVPQVDIFENDQDLVVQAELAGMDSEDVNLTVTDNVLTISGERRFEKDDQKESYHRVERLYGSFSRSFTLPRSIDESKIKADFKDGVLTVRLPKHEKARARQIEIAS